MEGEDVAFESDVGKIQANHETGVSIFDMGVEDANKLVEFCKTVEAGGAEITILQELEVERGRNFGRQGGRGGRGGRGGYGRGGRGGRGGYGRGGRGRGGGNYNRGNSNHGGSGGRGYRRESRYSSHDNR